MYCDADMARLMTAFKYAKKVWRGCFEKLINRKLRLVCNKTHLRI